MLFDLPPAELPVAKLEPRNARERIAAGLHAWVVAKWRWFKPRTIPMVVALAGLFAVIGSASYLRSVAHEGWESVPQLVVAPAIEVEPTFAEARRELDDAIARAEQNIGCGISADESDQARADLEALRKRMADVRDSGISTARDGRHSSR